MGVVILENTNCHNAFIYNRQRIEITGVIDVISFSESNVEAEYSDGILVVDGKLLKIEEFSGDSGKLFISGEIDGFYYFSKNKKETRSFFGKQKK